MKHVIGIIPARIGSTRLERKPLRNIGDKPLIQHVWESASKSELLSDLYIATDSQEIEEVSKSFSAKVLMTPDNLDSGSERVAYCINDILKKKPDCVLNIQGDMPFISQSILDKTIELLLEGSFHITTGATPIKDKNEFLEDSFVKVVLDNRGKALYFSRSPIPYSRDGECLKEGSSEESIYSYKHIGLYAYTTEALELFAPGARKSQLESIEKLEQLRALTFGLDIGVEIFEESVYKSCLEVNTLKDLELANNYYNLKFASK